MNNAKKTMMVSAQMWGWIAFETLKRCEIVTEEDFLERFYVHDFIYEVPVTENYLGWKLATEKGDHKQASALAMDILMSMGRADVAERSKTLSRCETIIEHRKMWNWVAIETYRRKCMVSKYEYFNKVIKIKNVPMNLCWCCQYDDNWSNNTCDCCPISWTDGCCNYDDSEWNKWLELEIADDNKNWYIAAVLAHKIAMLPTAGGM